MNSAHLSVRQAIYSFFLLVLLLPFSACEKTPSNTEVPEPTSASLVTQAATTARNQSSGNPHLAVELLAGWIRNRFTTTSDASTSLAVPNRLGAALTPTQAAVLFAALVQELGYETTFRLFYDVPTFGFYPLVEVIDQDGEHIWDPYAGRYFAGEDGVPVGFGDALMAIERTVEGPVPSPPAPDAATLFSLPSTPLSTREATVYPVRVSGETATWSLGEVDGASSDVHAKLAGYFGPVFVHLGNDYPIPRHVIAPQLNFGSLTAGAEYSLRGALVDGSPEALVLMAEGLQPIEHSHGGTKFHIRYRADQPAAKLTLGVAAGSGVELDTLSWEAR